MKVLAITNDEEYVALLASLTASTAELMRYSDQLEVTRQALPDKMKQHYEVTLKLLNRLLEATDNPSGFYVSPCMVQALHPGDRVVVDEA